MAKKMLSIFFYFFTLIRFLPHYLFIVLNSNKEQLIEERNYWIKIIKNTDDYSFNNLIWLLKYVPEYRSVLYFRLGRISSLLNLIARKRESLYINTPSANIGTGLIIQHGWATVVEAVKIGKNCQIWQNVTVGTNISHSGNKATIGDNVKISAGAIVLGNIKIGNNVTIGAGAVVVKDVPDNCIVVGNSARIIKLNGEKVNITL